MANLCKLDLTIFFEVCDAEFYGGKGSVGYSVAKYKSCDPQKLLPIMTSGDQFGAYMLSQRKLVANALHVSIENVRVISETEYSAHTKN